MKWTISGVVFIAIGLVCAYILFNYVAWAIGIIGLVAALLAIACGVALIVSGIFTKSSGDKGKEVDNHVC